jgi:hypothetical protein
VTFRSPDRLESEIPLKEWPATMANLTSDGAFELTLIFGYAFGAFSILSAVVSPTVKRMSGPHYRGAALIPLLFGLGIIVILLLIFGRETVGIFPTVERLTTIWTLIVSAGTVFLAVAVGTVVLLHIPQIIGGSPAGRRFSGSLLAVTALVAVLAVSAVVIFLAASNLAPSEVFAAGSRGQAGTGLVLEDRFHLEAPPLAMALRDSRSGYLALEDAGIFFFELPDGDGELAMTKVADVILPHGMLVSDDVLYVTSLGPFPCEGLPGGCRVDADSFPRGDSTILAFEIEPDGTLGPGRPIVTDLPSASNWHAVNGIARGPDGYLYTAIGNLRGEETSAVEDEAPNRRLLGTIIRYRPEDPEVVEVFATGIRNIFDLEFDDQGRLWGADNDGATLRGFKVEEALRIEQGDDFGYPRVGTYDPERVTPPVSALPESTGSAGLEWAPRIGMEPGLLIGSERKVEYLPLTQDERGFYVTGRDASHPTDVLVEARNGFVSVVEADLDGRLWVGTYGFRLDSELAIFRLAS